MKTSASRVLVGVVLLAGLWPATVAGQDVQFLTVTSRNTENVLEWVNPAGFDTVRIRFNSGVTCTPPPDATSGTLLTDKVDLDGPGDRDRFPHSGLTPDTTYCYGLFVDLGGSFSAGRSNSGRPMAPGAVKWAFSIGVTSMTAPTVGTAGIIATSNANVLHAMERGATPPGGEWPASWLPKPIGGPVQSRSPVIPINVGGANPVVYLGSQDGNVYVVDGVQGGAVADPWPPVPLGGLPGQAAPAGMFTAFGGSYDYLLVGTSLPGANNQFFAIDPITGATLESYDGIADTGKGFGPINGMASVDYGNNRVYFTSLTGPAGGNNTVWSLNLEPVVPGPVFTYGWTRAFSDIFASPVFANAPTGTLFVYTGDDDQLIAIEASTGSSSDTWNFSPKDGYVKEFVWPDRSNPGDVYLATDTCIWAFHHTGTTWSPGPKFGGCISLPGGAIPTSGVLVRNQLVYVGADDGCLYEIDVSGALPSLKSVLLGDGLATVGSPSLDWPNDLIHVGTEAGVFYAVQVPLP